jgi:hypothetical protein
MPLEGQWQRQHTPLRLAGRREGRAVAAAAVIVVLALGAALYAGLHHGAPRTAAGCIDVIAASTTGGAVVHACGASAARWCRLEAARGDAFARTVRGECSRLRGRR